SSSQEGENEELEGGSSASLGILTRVKRTFAFPPESVQDKVHFIFNNVSEQNLETKSAEFKQLVQAEYHEYLAYYIVVHRASMEPNFHPLYLAFLQKIGSSGLDQCILAATYENIKILLKSKALKRSA